jgi:hypothetical protein
MAKITALKQLLAKKYAYLPDLPDVILNSFGKLVKNFIMIIWGSSGNGKSNLIMQFVALICQFGKVLYVALEEGTESTMQELALRYLSEEHSGKVEWAESDMTFDELVLKLKKKKSPQFIIIDSVQYWDITYQKYKELKQMFKNKSFIFISHAGGKNTKGGTAESIRYDAGIKVWVEGGVAFPVSRYGGNKPYLIYEKRAKQYWGANLKKVLNGETTKRPPVKKAAPKKKAEKPVPQTVDEPF